MDKKQQICVGELSASQEDYLEAIFRLSADGGFARAKDIAAQMKVNKSSVTCALKALSEKGLVNYDPYSYITLSGEGLELARDITARHEALTEFFAGTLGIDPAVAEANACRIEHVIDKAVLNQLISHIKNGNGRAKNVRGDK